MGTLRVRRLPRPSTSLERTLTTANLTRELACRERLSSSKSTKSTKPFKWVWSGLVGSDLSFFFFLLLLFPFGPTSRPVGTDNRNRRERRKTERKRGKGKLLNLSSSLSGFHKNFSFFLLL